MRVLAFDTSNYTTSVASFDGTEGHNISRLLDVEQGALGLRQSDALFAHVKRLPELADRLFSDIGTDAGFEAVGVSTRPRAVEGSYMPCFLAGESQARVLGAALGVPVLPFSHQQGHIAASLWGSGHMELMDEPHLAWHLSGGTTELLRVTPEGKGSVHAEKIGGTTDISAGQLIDRTGKLLGLPFPSGKHIDALSRSAQDRQVFRVKVQGTTFSLSGVQNKVEQYHGREIPRRRRRAMCCAASLAPSSARRRTRCWSIPAAASCLRAVLHRTRCCAAAARRFRPFSVRRSSPRTTPSALPF